MIKSIIFDCRDTLIRVDRSYAAANRFLFEWVREQRPVSKTKFDAILHHAIDSIRKKHAGNPNIHDWNALFVRKLLISFNILISSQQFQHLLRAYSREFAKHAVLYPEVRPVLNQLRRKKIKIAVVIDGTEYRECLILRQLKLTKYFSSMVISEQVEKNKFTSLPLKRAIRKLQVKPKQIFVVGDRIDKDIVHANRLGCVSVKLERQSGRYTKNKGTKKIEQPNFTISSLRQLMDII